MNTEKKNKHPLKSAKKTFSYWFKVLLSTELMDNPQHRIEYLEALNALKIKKKKGV